MRSFLFLVERKKVHRRASTVEESQRSARSLSPPGAGGTRAGLCASRVGVTHRSRDVRARRPLAVGPGCGGAPDFLLFPQQLPVLLLPVLHVDQQRDEAVLHLDTETRFRAKLTCADDGEMTLRSEEMNFSFRSFR